MTFYGYPQAPGVHARRPWWRGTPSGWIRTDGWDLYNRDSDATIARIDREYPLPAPPPRCGQVWVWPGWREAMVCGINDGVIWPYEHFIDSTDWPPPGAVLVAGPGAPWAPPKWEPEEGK